MSSFFRKRASMQGGHPHHMEHHRVPVGHAHPTRMLKNSSTGAHHVQYTRETRAGPVGSARLHSRTMNKVVVVRPPCKAVVHGSAGLPTGQRGKRRLQIHLASPTSPARMGVSSNIMERVFQQPARVAPFLLMALLIASYTRNPVVSSCPDTV